MKTVLKRNSFHASLSLCLKAFFEYNLLHVIHITILQEHYTEIAHSTAVTLLDSKDVYLEFSGNLVPVTKSGSQPVFAFEVNVI